MSISTEDLGKGNAGLILKALSQESSTVERVVEAAPEVQPRDVYRELLLMLMYATGHSIQKHLPAPESHQPIMNEAVGTLVDALDNPPGYVNISGATQSFLSHEDAQAILEEMKLDSPTESLVPPRFTLWAKATQDFAAGEMLAHGRALGEALGIKEGSDLRIFAPNILSLFVDSAEAMSGLLLDVKAALAADEQRTEEKELTFGQGCLLGILGVALMLFALYYLA